MSGCTSIEVEFRDSQIIQGSTMIKYKNYIYYYDKSFNNNVGLFQYNIETKETTELDSFKIYGDLFLLDGELYYLSGENDKNFHVYCYNGIETIDRGAINDNLIYASTRRISSKECRLSLYNGMLYVLYNDKIYINTDGKSFEILTENISSFDVDSGNIYYSNCSGVIYQKNELDTEIVASGNDFEKNAFVNSSLGNEYRITNLQKNGDYLYFLIADIGSNLGKIFRISLENQQIEQLFYEGSTCRFLIADDVLYYYDFENCKIICMNCYSNKTNAITVSKNIYGFDVFDNVIYYSTINSDQQSLKYSKIQEGIEDTLFN